MSVVLDYNFHALCRLADNAYKSGRDFEGECLNQLIEGYSEGLWDVDWQDGEPIFKAILTEAERKKVRERKEGMNYV